MFKFGEFINENNDIKYDIYDLNEIWEDLHIVDFLFRCGLVNRDLTKVGDLDWSDREEVDAVIETNPPEYGDMYDLPTDFDIDSILIKVRAYAKAQATIDKNMEKYVKSINTD